MPDFDPLKSLIKKKDDADVAIDTLGKNAVAKVRKAMHEANKMANSGYPIAHEHMKRSIDGKGKITHSEKSKIAAAILNSAELKKLAKKYKASICLGKMPIFFTTNRDLARTLYRATNTGDLEISDKSFSFRACCAETDSAGALQHASFQQ